MTYLVQIQQPSSKLKKKPSIISCSLLVVTISEFDMLCEKLCKEIIKSEGIICKPIVDFDVEKFWRVFKTSVSNGDKDAIISMSKFPIGFYYDDEIKTASELRRRYNEVFSGETNAVKCFSKAEPYFDADDPEKFLIYCGFRGEENSEDSPIEYTFVKTKDGWKFNGFDNMNE